MTHGSGTGIAGAGLAGLSTALGLAQAGLPVEVFEAAPDSGWERSGSWDAVENWTTGADFGDQLARWGIAPTFEQRAVTRLEVYDPQGQRHTVTSDRPILYLVKRGSRPGALEYALKQQALGFGAAIHYNAPRARADVDVWAVGAQHRGQFLAAGLRFNTRQADTVQLLISARHAPRAYAYLFIVEGQGVLSVILTRNFAGARAYLQQSLEFFRRAQPLDMQNVRLASGFGGRRADFWQAQAGPLRVGEAAGFQDYLWGFGIRYALHSGRLAAQAIAGGPDYQQAVRSQIRPLVHASLLNRALYNRAGDGLYRLLIAWFAGSPQLVDLLRRRYRAAIPNPLLWLLRGNTAVPGGHG